MMTPDPCRKLYQSFCRLRRLSSLCLVALVLLAAFFATFQIDAALGTGRHRGGNGPDPFYWPPPPDGNAAAIPWGTLYVNGSISAEGVITLGYNGQEITTTVVSLPQYRDPLYMFDTRPARELSATFGATVVFTAAVPGFAPLTQTVRLLPDANGEVAVPFFFGVQPAILPTPAPPAPLLPTGAITNMVASHQMDAGDYHTCMVVTGQLRCWGANYYLQTGIGPLTPSNYVRNQPSAVTNITQTVRAVATGDGHTCVVLLNGRVQCFGYRWRYGTTGTDDPAAPFVTATPIDVQGVENAVDIVAGAYMTCALVRDVQNDTRRVKCWGMNNKGQLGNGQIDENPHPTAEYVLGANNQPLENVTAISAKGWHVCAVVAGDVQCWGSLLYIKDLAARPAPVPEVIPNLSNITAVEVGHYNSCAIQSGGAVYCWGSLITPTVSYTPQLISVLPTDVTRLAISRYAACALRAAGSVLCWGQGDYQQVFGILGNDAAQSTSIPVTIAGITNAVDITMGENHVCVRLSDAGAKCWGSNANGQIGDNTSPPYPYSWYTPLTVTAIGTSAVSVAAGDYHSCALVAGGVRCWGANGYGQLGAGYVSHLVSVPVTNLPLPVTMVTAGRQHTCALTAAGAVYCWGRNHVGQLGNSSDTDSSRPVSVTGLVSGVQAIAAGEHHTCALRTDGELVCWGSNWAGQLGNPTAPDPTFVPLPVVGLAGKVKAFGLGYDHTCAVTEAGVAQCWGYNYWGQLGRGTFSPFSSTPMTVTGLVSDVTAVAPGNQHTCAIVSDRVKCWGHGGYYQLGNNTPLPVGELYSTPIPIDAGVFPAAVVDLEAGAATNCARIATGETLCWGSGWNGQLGNGGITGSLTPITVTALGAGVTDIKVASGHMCARMADGSVRCWGDNMYGQIGNGYSLIQPAPVAVVNIQPARWTYMLYLAGDNDLSFYLDNISKALDRLPSSPDLNIAVFFDGQGEEDSYIWSTRDGAFNKWRIAEAESRTGDPTTLAEFIQWAHESFPAEHYYLSIANHGRGTSGIGWDTQNGTLSTPEALTPAGLRQALAAATSNGLWQFDVLHFDACLMGLIEVAHQVKEYAHYMIASENLTAALYPYDEYAGEVLSNPAIAPRELAVKIAGLYYNAEYMQINGYPRTISVLDLSQIGGVVTALDNLAGALAGNLGEARAAIAAARDQVQVFDASPDFTQKPPAYFTLTRADEYIDLRHFAQLMRSSPSPAVNAAAQALDAALAPGGFVVTTAATSGVERLVSGNPWDLSNAQGVAIYFPVASNPAGYQGYLDGSLFTFTAANRWASFLAAYLGEPAGATLPDPGMPPVLKPLLPIMQHCAGSQTCLWGAAYVDGLPTEGVTVSLAYPNGTAQSVSAVVPGGEFHPVFRFALDDLNVQPGDRLTLTALYSATEVQRALIFDPISGEQEIAIPLVTVPAITDPAGMPVPVAAAMRWAMLYPPAIDRGEVVSFMAEGAASDGSPIVAYRWSSDLDGELGASSSFKLSSARLQRGVHTIHVTAINEQGVESPPATLMLTVTAPPPASLLLAPAQTTIPAGGQELAIPVRVLDRFGAGVVDGTPVRAETTAGDLAATEGTTTGGLVTFVLRSAAQPGDAVVRITAGAASSEITIVFVPVPTGTPFRLHLPMIVR